MWATKNIKLNVSSPCLNERTSKELFAETTKGDKAVHLSRVNLDISIYNKVV